MRHFILNFFKIKWRTVISLFGEIVSQVLLVGKGGGDLVHGSSEVPRTSICRLVLGMLLSVLYLLADVSEHLVISIFCVEVMKGHPTNITPWVMSPKPE